MAAFNVGNTKPKKFRFIDGNNSIDVYVKKFNVVYNGTTTTVWKSGSTVTYVVDTSTSYTEEVDSDATCLSPKTFTPTKSGWTFVGWREDKTASSSVLTSKTMNDSPITLYAVFSKDVKATYYNNSSTASSSTKKRYYNNGNTVNPTFNLSQASVSGWTARGWSTSNSGNATITYNNATNFTLSSNATLYGSYSKSITVTYYDNSSTAKTSSGTAYRDYKGTETGASFTLSQTAVSGWTARGWSTGTGGSSTVTYNNATAFTRTSNVTLYGTYSKSVTVTYYNNSTTSKTTSGTAYRNYAGTVIGASFTLSQASKSGWSAIGWTTGTAGNSSITYKNATAFTRDSNVTLYGRYEQTITVTYYDMGTSGGKSTGTRSYNSNGNVVNPSFTLNQYIDPYWDIKGWTTGTSATDSITYNSGAAFTRDSNVTLYAIYHQNIVLTTIANGTTSTQTKIRAYNASGNYYNPKFTVSNPSKSGATFLGWSWDGSANVANATISDLELTSSITRYAIFKYADTTLKTGWSGYVYDYGNGGGLLSNTILSNIDGTKYSSITANVQVVSFVCAVWAYACNAYVNLKTMSGNTAVDNKTLRYRQTIGAQYEEEWETAAQIENTGYPCTNGAAANVTLNLSNSTGLNLVLSYEGDVFKADTYVTTITAAGRTVVG